MIQIAESIRHLENGTVNVHKDTSMSLYENINRRKRLGISRSKKDSTISKENYEELLKQRIFIQNNFNTDKIF